MHAPTDRHRAPLHREAGFTLAELLVVVAIVGVLVAIAIPVFTSQLEKAQAATCLANRRSMYAEVVTSAMNSEKTELQVFEELYAEEGHHGYSCPKNGTWEWIEATRTITCSEHPDEAEENELPSLEKSLTDWIQNTFPPNTGFYDPKIKEMLASQGIVDGGDTGLRQYYAKVNNKESWDKIATDENETTLYLEFKGYKNSTEAIFYYAGYESSPQTKDWKARYIYDVTSSSWYDLGSVTNIANIYTKDNYDALIKNASKANLINGKFEAAS